MNEEGECCQMCSKFLTQQEYDDKIGFLNDNDRLFLSCSNICAIGLMLQDRLDKIIYSK